MSTVSFKPDEFREAAKEFRGVIYRAEYSMTPFGFEGDPTIKRKTPQLAVAIDTDAYDKLQYEWYPPTNVQKTKWAYFIEALTKVGAMKDVNVSGATDEERLENFAKSLVGMDFHWVQLDLELVIKGRTVEMLIPDAYFGKKTVKPVEEIREEQVEL